MLNCFIQDYNSFELFKEEVPYKPKHGNCYFIADITSVTYYTQHIWSNDVVDRTLFERGLIYKTKEEAIAKAKQMLGIIE